MALDIWWLVWGIFIVTIVERSNLMDESKRWFNMFAVILELVSAFGGIGLSLGNPIVRHINYASLVTFPDTRKHPRIITHSLVRGDPFPSSWSLSLCGRWTPNLVCGFHADVRAHRVRGRHRGLPVAVDRAVLLPSEMVTNRLDGAKRTGDDPTQQTFNYDQFGLYQNPSAV